MIKNKVKSSRLIIEWMKWTQIWAPGEISHVRGVLKLMLECNFEVIWNSFFFKWTCNF